MIDYTDVTPETIAACRAAANLERRQVERLTGCTILPDGKILLPEAVRQGLRLAVAIQVAVYGTTRLH